MKRLKFDDRMPMWLHIGLDRESQREMIWAAIELKAVHRHLQKRCNPQ